jgi:3-hydroxyisobutyrate dehydrogenase-like beta-hydroxyacid dehydrogenase
MLAVLHPGQMGSAVARALTDAGHQVGCALDHRSVATRERARTLGLADAGSVGALISQSEVVFSVCPPHASLGIARVVAGYHGIFVDANAVAPRTAMEVAAIVESAGATYVDAAIIGPPPGAPGDTRLYLSGAGASDVASLFAGTLFDARVLSTGPFAASALKMMYAAWTKGTAALLLSVDAAARRLGVDGALIAEWEESEDQLNERVKSSARSAAAKAWRWSAEMKEVATTFAQVGAPEAFHLGAAEIFARLPRDLAPDDPHLRERIGDALTRPAPGPNRTDSVRRAPPVRRHPGVLLSALGRSADMMSLDELLSSWAIKLRETEEVTWFGLCTLGTTSGFVLVTSCRLCFVELAGKRALQERTLHSIVAVEERGVRRRRLRIRGEDWEIEVRGLGAGQSISQLRQALLGELADTDPRGH